MKINLNNQAGFTLIELLMYIAVAAVILTALSTFFSLALSVRVKAQSVAEVEQQGALVLNIITQTARNASAITSPVAGSSSTSLTITVPTGIKSPTTFDVASGTIRIKEGASSTINLTDSHVIVTNLRFYNLTSATNEAVKVGFTLSRVNASSTNEYNYTQNFSGSATLR